MTSVTKTCQRESGDPCGQPVTVVDTPGLFDTNFSNEEIQQEIMRCTELLAPGPHVFLLVIAVGPFTKEERETLQLIKMTFGQKAETYTMVLFTRGDNLSGENVEDFIKEADPHVQKLINDCGGRFHVFNNKQKDPDQVLSLLKKITKMMWNNNPGFYSNKMFQEAERAFRLKQINREREEEVRREMEAIKAKYESEIKEIQDKLEEEKAKGIEREFLFLERENTLLRSYQAGKMDRVTRDTKQTQDHGKSKAHVEEIKNYENEECLVRKGETQQGATGGESDQDKNKNKNEIRFVSEDTKPRGNYHKVTENHKEKETTNQKEKRTITGKQLTITDQKIRKNTGTFMQQKTLKQKDQTDTKKLREKMPKNPEARRDVNEKCSLEQYKAMQECKQKMEEIKKRYKEIEEIQTAELRKMQERLPGNITAWNKTHGGCVLQ
ncbi:hypothetical protein QQF64_024123 [Cirrhinus molitorella]|uniref:AIG1-type G domain-containing protein n=1 Tax=Cirrhinus molitorella TaxID=172907 RepID=A0ABR3NLJ8_9TELE